MSAGRESRVVVTLFCVPLGEYLTKPSKVIKLQK